MYWAVDYGPCSMPVGVGVTHFPEHGPGDVTPREIYPRPAETYGANLYFTCSAYAQVPGMAGAGWQSTFHSTHGAALLVAGRGERVE